MPSVVEAAVESLYQYLRLGNHVVDAEEATFVRNPAWPGVMDANHGQCVHASHVDDIAGVLARADHELASSSHRAFRLGPETPPSFEARLVLDGYQHGADLEMVLTGWPAVAAGPTGCEIRTVTTENDWDVVHRLKRLDHQDEAGRTGRPARSAEATNQMFLSKKAKSPAVRYFLARLDGSDCAFFSAWPGDNGTGVVEDLFTLPAYRRRGVATALIAHAVNDAHERGAEHVLIGADPNDTPKHMYASLGFRPLVLLRSYWRTDQMPSPTEFMPATG